jgi:hypothetical protein
MDRPETTGPVEDTGGIESQKIESRGGIQSLTDLQERSSNAMLAPASIDRHFSNIHGNCAIGEAAYKANNPVICDRDQGGPGVLPGQQ